MDRKFGAITSSTNSEEISNRIKGITIALSSIIIFFAAKFFHMTLTPNDVLSLATEFAAVGGAIWTLYGTGMAVWAHLFKQD